MTEVPKWWIENLPCAVQPLMEEFLLGLAALPEDVSKRVSDMFEDPGVDDSDIVRFLFHHQQANGGDTRALVAMVKIIAREIDGDEG